MNMAERGDNCHDLESGTNCVDSHNDVAYFTSYGDLEVHELMLKDKPRTRAYKDFIESNKGLFINKIVVDVGAGTGILSLFAAAAGAKKVYAIEASDIALACKAIVVQNGYEDVITVLHQRVEDVMLPPGVKADIIVSEWMGFYLLHESMLDSVIVARDKFLKDDGTMLPSQAALYLCPVNMKDYYKDKFEFWKDVYGFDYSPLIPAIIVKSLQQPTIATILHNNCICEPQVVTRFDLKTVTLDDIMSIERDFAFDINDSTTVHGFACWFDVHFESSPLERKVTLSTGPSSPETHWKQTLFNLPAPLLVDKGDAVKCRIELEQDEKNIRRYNISLELLEMPELGVGEENGAEEDCEVGGESEDEDTEDHPTPCDCDAPRCRIVKALIAKYDEQDAMMSEEGVVDITPEELENAINMSDNNLDVS